MARLLLVLLVLLGGQPAAAQGVHIANGVFLVARPGMQDPNFRHTVVLVTQTEDYSTVGVILNRPVDLKLSEILGDQFQADAYRDPVFSGGPVMQNALIVLFHADVPPAAPAFHVLRTLYMSLHPDNLREMLASKGRRYRIYAGFAGWAPRQLESEFERAGWFVLPADEDTVFRRDTGGLWEELAERAQALKTKLQMSSPAEGGAGMPG